jgi:cytochrome c oxidase subunit 1
VLPELGYTIERTRLLALQPFVYSAGQLLHISGLAISGGYGVQRKVAGAEQVLHGAAQTVGMGMMGLGGLLAALGGLCFLIIAISALRNVRRTAATRRRIDLPHEGLRARA